MASWKRESTAFTSLDPALPDPGRLELHLLVHQNYIIASVDTKEEK